MPRRTLLSAEARSRLFGIPTERAKMAPHNVLEEADLELVEGVAVSDEMLAHLVPFGCEHISLTGNYDWAAASPPPGGFRPLRNVRFVHDLDNLAF
ncbi:hypothetical protein [Falsiroseomonas sp. E2-1-a20]|uniref:hypothetical protein n=1 Tax=Falsiroseomonas sp. E2-1-a20 TaxID=3239300 RepID=UPI003F2F9F74